ncbi:MAG: redox-regulated ATPase YchF [Gammaproteobacteria bacterium]|nr:redox-regulated ATPase YchF [Gammaproteobacteria bacterium]
MGFKCGIVGLPNVGKSTLFNAMTSAGVAAENYPFCTIDPNAGVVAVPDERLGRLAGLAQSARVVPTTLEFVDIAGLVAGASRGEGLGNRFLSHIRETDAIAQVVRCFDDGGVAHVAGRVNPLSDIETIHTELLLADLESVERAAARAAKSAKSGDKEALARAAALQRLNEQLAAGGSVRDLDLRDDERVCARELSLLTAKPMLLIANTGEDDDGGAHRRAVADYAARSGLAAVEVCARFEAELAGLEAAERGEFLEAAGLREAGLDRIAHAGYRLLDLLTFFTAGPKEARAWTVAAGATAPRAAGRIHGDFEKGFVRAEIIAYADYIACGGEQQAKDAGKWRLEGRDYVMQEGDVAHFRFTV